MNYFRLWVALTAVVVLSFAVLGWYGVEIYRQSPPIPDKVVTADGKVLFTGQDIKDGQNVWQSMGGQEVGSIWGHGAYVAPDWSADYLHREAVAMLDGWAGGNYGALKAQEQAGLKARLKEELRGNTYDPAAKTITVSAERAKAMEQINAHYAGLFGSDPNLEKLRGDYAIATNAVPDPARMAKMNAFFFWAAWACSTERPGKAITYTNNWPHEPLIDNVPTGNIVLWSIASVVLLLAGVGALAWYFAVTRHRAEDGHVVPGADPLMGLKPTASMKATLKYFWVVAALMMAQIGLGAVTAHYGVEGQGFYGIPLAKWLPYAVTRTWHTQLGIFWIATAWLATGLFVAPAVSGKEPKFQRAGVNFLFVCLLIIVVGSLAGQWLGVQQKLGLVSNFWFGHQGYEYVDLGRFWQIFLLVGLFLWLGLVVRALAPAFKNPGENKHLLGLFLVSSAAIGLFYAAGLMWGRQTHLAMAEYWRWWVIHLWVEGFFEVFATVVIAFLFTHGPAQESDGHGGGDVLVDHLPERRHHRHDAPPVLHGHADGGAGIRFGVQRAGDRAAGADRLRGDGKPEPHAQPEMGAGLQVADLLLHRGGVLEPGGRGPVRVPHQPADRALLPAGPQHDAGPRPHGAVRRVRHAGHRPDAVLAERAGDREALAHGRAVVRVLEHQHRAGRDGAAEPVARGHSAGGRQRQRRHVVRAVRGISADAADGEPALDARSRRPDLLGRYRGPWLVYPWAQDGLVDRSRSGRRVRTRHGA
jgi:nitric oxide reductase large subunit